MQPSGANYVADTKIQAFQQTVWEYYDAHGRHDLPWRLPSQPSLSGSPGLRVAADGSSDDDPFDAYQIMVSELMLQQTQVARVIPKFQAFIRKFPDVQSLAAAPLSDVLTMWSGLGYNRRAKFLWQAAQAIVRDFSGQVPCTKNELMSLPGIGANTAGAIMAYAFNQPVVFVETNVRTVFFHHFFGDQTDIPDKSLVALIGQSLPTDNARTWYWALMDYGTHLKQTVGNLSRASAHYAKQSAFAGSRRQIRGHILRLLTETPRPMLYLYEAIYDERLEGVLADLIQEGFIEETGSHYRLRA